MSPDESDSPWRAPTDSAISPPWTALSGFVVVCVAHGLCAGVAVAFGLHGWWWVFGVAQLGFLVPLVGGLRWSDAPRNAVIGVYSAAAMAFALNAVRWAISLLPDRLL